jgi:AAA family ATP:ADP antiporter
MDALGRKETSRAARGGLAAFGDRVAGTLGDYLSDACVDFELRWAIPYVLSDIGTQEAVNALFRARDRSDVSLTFRILKASNRVRSANPHIQFPPTLVTEDLERDARDYARAVVQHRSGQREVASTAERLLGIALRERMDQGLVRVFRRLGLLYPPRDILAAYRGVTSNTPKQRGNAVEYLENVLNPGHRALVLPLVEPGEDMLLGYVANRYKLSPQPYGHSLAEILRGDDSWLCAVALYVVGARREREMAPLVDSNLAMPDPRVRNAARWARLALSEA